MPKIVKSGRKLGKSGKNSKKIKEFTTFPLLCALQRTSLMGESP